MDQLKGSTLLPLRLGKCLLHVVGVKESSEESLQIHLKLAAYFLCGDTEKLLFLFNLGFWLSWSKPCARCCEFFWPILLFNMLDEVIYLLQVILLRFPSLLCCVASQQIELPNEISADLPKYALQQHVLSLNSWEIQILLGLEGFLDSLFLFVLRWLHSLTYFKAGIIFFVRTIYW